MFPSYISLSNSWLDVSMILFYVKIPYFTFHDVFKSQVASLVHHRFQIANSKENCILLVSYNL